MTSDTFRAEVEYEIAHPRQSVLAALPLLGLRADGRLLDVGCGAGVHLGLFARALGPAGQVVGLDRDAARLDLAAAPWESEIAAGQIALRAGDHDALPATDGAFDCAWAAAVLHHAQDPLTTLREMARAVRPGGTVAVLDADTAGSFPLLPWSPELDARLRAAAWAAHAADYDGALPYHFSGYIGRELPRLLREAGLRGIGIHPLPEVERPPLDPRRAAQLRDWLLDPFAGRLRDFLAPRDFKQLQALFDPASNDDILWSPDFFLARTWFLAIGHVPATR